MAAYLAIQHTRTPEQRERVLFPDRLATYLAGRELTLQLASAFLRDEHLHFAPSANEVQAVFDFASVALREDEPLTPAFAMDAMLRSVEQLAPAIDELEWTVEHDRKGRLFTSDAPLVIWRPPTRRDEFEGVGLGNAQEIRFPLDPTKQLVLSRRPRPSSVRVNSDRVANCNADTVAACYQFVIAPPKLERRVREVDMRPHRPVLRFGHAPGYERQPDGTDVYMGDVLHTWVPRR